MHRHGNLAQKTVWIATLAMMVQPQWLLAADNISKQLPNRAAAQPVSKVTDVALGASGILTGQAVDATGKPLARTELTITNGRVKLRTITDQQGAFRVTNLQGGVYRVEMGRQTQFCRVWMLGTAPPSATAGLLVVQNGDLALGQSCGCGTGVSCGSPVCGGRSRVKSLLANPLVFGGLVAAAIAIPVAIHNADDDDDPTS